MIIEPLRLNKSNKRKLKEYQRLFKVYDISLESTDIDLDEIYSDHMPVVSHKAFQVSEGVLVEDTSLEVEGVDIDVNIRWELDALGTYQGKKVV